MRLVKRLLSLMMALCMVISVGAQGWAETLTLPSSLEAIEDEAFAGDTSLNEVVIPEGIERIESLAFADSSVTKINLPFSLKSIGEDAFQGSNPIIRATVGTYGYQWANEKGLNMEGAVSGELSASAMGTLGSNPAYASLTARRLTVNGIPLYDVYKNDGQKKPLVIVIHGGGGSKDISFKSACDMALQGFYCAAIDCAGCGDSEVGPIDSVNCWSMTVSQIDSLIEYYRDDPYSQADVERFGLRGSSMGGNIAFAYVVHGSYRPTIIVPDRATPDYRTLPFWMPGPLFDAFDHGKHCQLVLSPEEIFNLADDFSPIHQPEKFLDVYIYSGNGTADTTTGPEGCEALEDWLNNAGGRNHLFKYYEGCDHGDPYPNFDSTGALRWALLENTDQSTALAFESLDSYDYLQERAAFSDNPEIGLYHESWIRNYQIVNYDALAGIYGGEPEWSVEFVGESHGASLSYQIGNWAGDGARAIDVMIDEEPTYPCTVRYAVTCTWGGHTITGNGILNYRRTALPTSLEAAEEYRGLKVGETYTFRPEVKPAGYSYGDSEYCLFRSDMDCESRFVWEDGRPVRRVQPKKAGIYSAWLGLRYTNIAIKKRVTLYVADENGVIPNPPPALNMYYDFTMFLPVADTKGYEVDIINKTRGISLSNWDLMKAVYGDEYTWTFTSEEGSPELGLSCGENGRAFQFEVGNLYEMANGSNATVKAVLKWGSTETETTLQFHFYNVPLPEHVYFDQDIRMRTDETYRSTVSVEPADWFVFHYLYINLDDSMSDGSLEYFHDVSKEPEAFYIRASEPGYYLARPRLGLADNAAILGDFTTVSVVHGDGWHVVDEALNVDVAEYLASDPAYAGIEASMRIVEGIPLLEVYKNDGQPKPLVFILHGAGGNRLSFCNQAVQFAAEGFYSVAIDLPACGDSDIGPINAPTMWNMTVSQLDLLVEYYNTVYQADAAHFGIWGLSFGGIISSIFVAHGKYMPTIIAPLEATPDLSKMDSGANPPPVFDHGNSNGVGFILSKEELASFRNSMQPIDQLEKLASVYIYAVNRPNDKLVDPYGFKKLKDSLNEHNYSTQKLLFEFCMDGKNHGVPMRDYYPKSHMAFRQILLGEEIESPFILAR